MSDDDLDIPDFLRIPQDRRNAGWKGRTMTKAKAARKLKADWGLPATMDAAAWKLKHEQDRAREAAKKARLAALRERRR